MAPDSQVRMLPDDDDIDLGKYFSQILVFWRVILTLVFVGAVCGLVYYKISPRQFQSNLTFFIPPNSGQMDRRSGGVGDIVPGYLSMFVGGGGASSFESYLNVLMKSRKLEKMLIADFVGIVGDTPNEVQAKLQLHNIRLMPRFGVYELVYANPDKTLVVPVLESYIKNLTLLNEQLMLGAQKTVIRVIDDPIEPRGFSRPKLLVSVGIGAGSFGLLGILVALGIGIWQDRKSQLK